MEGKREFSEEDIESIMAHISEHIAKTANISEESARTYAEDFKPIYLDALKNGEELSFAVAWGAILHVSKIADLENAQSQFLASRAPSSFSCPQAKEVTIKICRESVSRLDGDAKAAVLEALDKIDGQGKT